MFKLFRHIYRGAGYLEGYGYHPGNLILVLFSLIIGLSVIDKGFGAFLLGSAAGLVTMLPLYIMGCIDRSKDSDRAQSRLLRKIKES